jgi:DNA repair protein RecO (recombination protein O)
LSAVEKNVTFTVVKLPMSPTLATPAIVLRSRPYGESDKIVCLLTENYGKVTGIAKGAKRSRKRFANSLEPFSLVNLRFQDRPHGGLVFIQSADLAVAFKRLATSLEKIALASYLSEITDGLTGERDESAPVFEHLKNGLIFLECDDAVPLEFLASYELTLLRLAGYQPALDSCKHCSITRQERAGVRWYFSLVEGGVLCGLCAQSRSKILPLGSAALTALTRLQKGPDAEPLPAAVLREIRLVIESFLRFHMGREIRSAAFLSKFVAV